MSSENIILDTRRSFEFVSNHFAYSYPSSQYNETVIEALREVGITIAFVGEYSYVTAGSDPFALERFVMYRDTTFHRFRNIVNGRLRA